LLFLRTAASHNAKKVLPFVLQYNLSKKVLQYSYQY